MNARKLFTTKMFLVLLIPVVFIVVCAVLYALFHSIDIGSYGVNKTVGWAWDLTNLYVVIFPLYFIYLLGYGVLFLFKTKTNYIISISHFISIFLSFVYFEGDFTPYIKTFIILASLIFFVINMVSSLVTQIKLNRSSI